MEIMEINLGQKSTEKYCCFFWDYITSRTCHYKRYADTKNTNGNFWK